jgi:hypothetical protein
MSTAAAGFRLPAIDLLQQQGEDLTRSSQDPERFGDSDYGYLAAVSHGIESRLLKLIAAQPKRRGPRLDLAELLEETGPMQVAGSLACDYQ